MKDQTQSSNKLSTLGLADDSLHPDLEQILMESYASTRVFSKAFFPDRFYAPFSKLHDQIFDAIDSGIQKIVIAAPRGIGKTSIAGLALPSKKLLFRDTKFLVYVSQSATSAELQTENLKRELISNELVRELFGTVKPQTGVLDETFSKKAWATNWGSLVLPRGSGQQVRGVIYGNARPDLIIVDDLEDSETISNDEVRKKRKDWFFADLLKCVSRVDKNWTIIYIDTLKHEDSLLQELLDASDWMSLRLELFDDNYRSNAPEFVSDDEIKAEVESYREKGLLDVLYREYRNIPISTEDAVFQSNYFRYYEPPDLVNDLHVEYIIIVDPAKTVKLHSAESAVVGIGIDRGKHRIYIHDVVARKLYPDELYNEIFLMASKLRARVLGIEVTGLNEFIVQPIKNEMTKRGKYMELVELKARASKEERIAALAPYYRQGYIYHNSGICGGLESQLLGFPRSKRWDIMDAVAYVVEMLELGDRYFEGPESDEDAELEFKELMRSYEPEDDGWRIAP